MSGTGQLGFAEAFMSAGLGTNRKLERLDALIDWSRLERLACACARGTPGSSALCAAGDAEGALSSGALRPLRPRPGGGAAGPALVPALLRLCAGWGHAGRDHDLPLPRGRRRGPGGGVRGDQPPAGCRRPDPAQGHADGRDAGGLGLAAAALQGGCGGRAPTGEPGAGWTRKKGRGFFGYKAHLGVDQGSGIDPSPGSEFGQDLRERGCGSADLRRRGGGLWRSRLRGQAATGEAQGLQASRTASCTGATSTWPRCRPGSSDATI